MKLRTTSIEGVFELLNSPFDDERGRFVKVFHQGIFENLGLHTKFPEQYYSISKRGVIRGMHFQAPPYDHEKVVYCPQGKAFDVVVDLRKYSSTYGQCEAFELDQKKGNAVYMPKGVAHGFCSLEDNTIMVYMVATMHEKSADNGVLWSSIPVDWPIKAAVISERDSKFVHLAEFHSPF